MRQPFIDLGSLALIISLGPWECSPHLSRCFAMQYLGGRHADGMDVSTSRCFHTPMTHGYSQGPSLSITSAVKNTPATGFVCGQRNQSWLVNLAPAHPFRGSLRLELKSFSVVKEIATHMHIQFPHHSVDASWMAEPLWQCNLKPFPIYYAFLS